MQASMRYINFLQQIQAVGSIGNWRLWQKEDIIEWGKRELKQWLEKLHEYEITLYIHFLEPFKIQINDVL